MIAPPIQQSIPKAATPPPVAKSFLEKIIPGRTIEIKQDIIQQLDPYQKNLKNHAQVLETMRNVESRGHGGYQAQSKSSSAMGAYQILQKQLPHLSKEFLGREYTKDELLKDPSAQDQIMRGFLDKYTKSHSFIDAISMWFMGHTFEYADKHKLKDANGLTVRDYWSKFVGEYRNSFENKQKPS